MSSETFAQDQALRIHLGRAGKKLLRLDQPSLTAASGGERAPDDDRWNHAAESPSLIAMILEAVRARSNPVDRREAARHEAAGRKVWVGWWSGSDFGAVQGHARDISRGGAKLVVAIRPPRRQPVWLYKEVEDTMVCVRAEVVGHTPAPGSLFAVRFRFCVPCPTALLEAVVCEPRPARRRVQPRFDPPGDDE
jgi:hypothetical protein